MSSYLAFPSLPSEDGGLFLLPFSGGYPRLTLSAILPYDARTFLTAIPFGMMRRGRPTKLPLYYTTLFLISQVFFFKRHVMHAQSSPLPSSVKPENRQALLELLERDTPLTPAALSQETGLSIATVRRALRELTDEGILTLQYDRLNTDFRRAEPVGFVRYPVLTVLELAETHFLWRLGDTHGGSVYAALHPRGGFLPPEDDLALLMSRVRTVLRSGTCRLPREIPLQAPVLLLPDGKEDPTKHPLTAIACRDLDITPTAMMTMSEAVALEMSYLPATRSASSVLYLEDGKTATATLLVRHQLGDVNPPFAKTHHVPDLTTPFLSHIRNHPPSSTVRLQKTGDFLRDLLRYLRPDCVVLEADHPVENDTPLREALPEDISLLCHTRALNTPSLAHLGALRVARKALWKRM